MKNLSPVLIIFALGVFSCETVVDIDIPRNDDRLVVNAILEEDSSIFLSISKSRFSLSSQPIQNITGASATLFEGDLAVATLKDTVNSQLEEGWYHTDYRLKEDTPYRLEVTKEGFPPVATQMRVPKAVPIANLQFSSEPTSKIIFINNEPVELDGKRLTTIDLTIDDPPGKENYYEVVVFEDGVVQYLYEFDENDEPFIAGQQIGRFEAYLSTDDPVVSTDEFIDGNNSFFGNSLVFSDETFDGKRYTLSMNYEGSTGFSLDPFGNYLFFLRSISREQYLYIKSLELQRETEGNPFAEPVPVYNNIIGGYGIFVGFSHDSRRIKLVE